MKRVLTYLPEGHTEGDRHAKIRNAADITESERYAYDYRCLAPDCGAEFHLRRCVRPLENTMEVSATFARNRSSKHKPGCDYDYESKAAEHRDAASVKDGQLHLRINFPIGAAYGDRHPGRGRLTAVQRAAAQNNTGKKAVGTAAGLVKYLERAFGGLENPALENLVLHYQGRSYDWPETFVSSRDYVALYNAAADETKAETKGLLCIVRPEREINPNDKGKRRFTCTALPAVAGGKAVNIRPVITCETGMLAQGIKPGAMMLVAGRPFIPPRVLKASDLLPQLTVYLHVVDASQFAVIGDEYWSPVPGIQAGLYGGPR